MLAAEVVLCGRLDAVHSAAECRDVQVSIEDLVLRELLLERDRVPHLLQLALRGGFGCSSVCHFLLLLGLRLAHAVVDEHVLHVLLRDRRAALHVLIEDVGAHRTADGPLDVDAAVLVEPRVLTGDRGILDVLADGLPCDLLAVLVEERRQVVGRTVGLHRIDVRLLRKFADVEVSGKILEHGDAVVRGHAGHCQRRGHRSGDEYAGESAQADETEDSGADVAHRTILGRHIVELNGEGWQKPLRGPHAAVRRHTDVRRIDHRIDPHPPHQRRGIACRPGSTSPHRCSSTTPPQS